MDASSSPGARLRDHLDGVGVLDVRLEVASQRIDCIVPGAEDDAIYYRLMVNDRQSLVILGDPTLVLPPLPSQATEADQGHPTTPRAP